MASAIRQGRMHFHPVDLGATRLKGAPGGPIDTSHRSQWPSYWRQPVLRTVRLGPDRRRRPPPALPSSVPSAVPSACRRRCRSI